MKSSSEIIDKLKIILLEKEPIKLELIKAFQNDIWNDESLYDGRLTEILTELAYDLDFYEPNAEWKSEDSSYYGNAGLDQRIKSGINKIENYNKDF